MGNTPLDIWIPLQGLKSDLGCRFLRLRFERAMPSSLDFLTQCSFQICYFPSIVCPGYWFRKFVTLKGLWQSPGVWAGLSGIHRSTWIRLLSPVFSPRSYWCLFSISSACTSSFLFCFLSPFLLYYPILAITKGEVNSLFLTPNYFWFHSQIWPTWDKIQKSLS